MYETFTAQTEGKRGQKKRKTTSIFTVYLAFIKKPFSAVLLPTAIVKSNYGVYS